MGIARTHALQLLLPVLAVLAVVSAAGPGHPVLAGLVVLGMVAVATAWAPAEPLAARVTAVRRRSAGCLASGVRSADPDRQGVTRPRAPGRG